MGRLSIPVRKKQRDPGFEAVPAVIVADQRTTLGKRLGVSALALLFLFFVISGYIQSARNGAELDKASDENRRLANSLEQVTSTLEDQSKLVIRLQAAIQAQNIALREAGIDPLSILSDEEATLIPPDAVIVTPSPGASPLVDMRPSVSPRSGAAPATEPSVARQPDEESPARASPSPSPRPSPLIPVGEVVCNLTGICTTPR